MSANKKNTQNFSQQQVEHIAELANIPIVPSEAKKLANDFDEILSIVENLQELDTSNIEPIHQITGLVNITRKDVVGETRMFTQEEALANASHTHQGYFLVPAVMKNKKKS